LFYGERVRVGGGEAEEGSVAGVECGGKRDREWDSS